MHKWFGWGKMQTVDYAARTQNTEVVTSQAAGENVLLTLRGRHVALAMLFWNSTVSMGHLV